MFVCCGTASQVYPSCHSTQSLCQARGASSEARGVQQPLGKGCLGSLCPSPGQRTFPGHSVPRDELPTASPVLLLCFQVTLFVYSDLLLFTKEDEPGRCNVLRNPLYLHSVKLQEGECLQSTWRHFGGFLAAGCRGFWPAPPLLSLHLPGSSISWDTSGAPRPFAAFLGAWLRIWAGIPRVVSHCDSRDWPRLGKGTEALRFPP